MYVNIQISSCLELRISITKSTSKLNAIRLVFAESITCINLEFELSRCRHYAHCLAFTYICVYVCFYCGAGSHCFSSS